MRLHILCTIIFYCISLSAGRLVQRVTDKPKGEMSSNGDNVDLSASKGEHDGPEIIHFYKGKVRIPREDNKIELTNITRKNINPQGISRKALVKKPIPKYREIDSDEDYLSKQLKTTWQSRLLNTVEHEDEDFSLDDYDFDVNHDEFAGRGKPLEPRKEPKLAYEEIKSKSVRKTKRNPVTHKIPNVIRSSEEQEPLIKQTKKGAIKIKDDDDKDDVYPTTVLAGERPSSYKDDDSEDEMESSTEYIFVRNARSPWNIGTYVDKIGEKTSAFVTKILSFLPLFPQIPENKKIDGAISNP